MYLCTHLNCASEPLQSLTPCFFLVSTRRHTIILLICFCKGGVEGKCRVCLAQLTEIIGVQTLQQDEEYLPVSSAQLLLFSFFTSLPNSPFYLSPLVTSPLGSLSLLQIVPPFSLNWSFTFHLDTLHLRSQIVPAGGDRSILLIKFFSCKQALKMLIHPVCLSVLQIPSASP